MTDAKTMAYVNMYAVLGSLQNLCGLCPEVSGGVAAKKPVSVCFDVKDGPKATFTFDNGTCNMQRGVKNPDIRIPVSSCEKFNKIISGEATPIPTRGLTKVGFLLGDFTKLTGALESTMRGTARREEDPEAWSKTTEMMFYTIVCAIAEIGNHDKLGQISAKGAPDGIIAIEAGDRLKAYIAVRGGRMRGFRSPCKNPRAVMRFESEEVARGLFDGDLDAMGCIGSGKIAMSGFIPLVDQVNRVLNRVGEYLA
ncbi:MAG: hypothetical protein LIO46_00115 [Clostridiales bacterium]|nr:hypothetical protein [Clostridiales bacterium]